MSCLFSGLIILVVAIAAATVQAQETFVLQSDMRSQLFSQCMDELSTVQGSLYSILVEADIEYIRFDASGSSRAISWDSESSILDTIGCAFRAHERGAFMFKFTSSGGCQLALDNVYDRSQPSCGDSEIVYIVNTGFCLSDSNAHRVEEMTDDNCPQKCTEEGIVSSNGLIATLRPNTPPGCCPTSSDPCLSVGDNIPATWCEALDFCKAFGLEIPSVESADDRKGVVHLLQAVYSKGGVYRFAWVNIYKDNDGVWRHRASQNPVDESLWGSGELSNPGNCAVVDDMGDLKPVTCDADYNVMCRGVEDNFPACTKPLDGFVHM